MKSLTGVKHAHISTQSKKRTTENRVNVIFFILKSSFVVYYRSILYVLACEEKKHRTGADNRTIVNLIPEIVSTTECMRGN